MITVKFKGHYTTHINMGMISPKNIRLTNRSFSRMLKGILWIWCVTTCQRRQLTVFQTQLADFSGSRQFCKIWKQLQGAGGILYRLQGAEGILYQLQEVYYYTSCYKEQRFTIPVAKSLGYIMVFGNESVPPLISILPSSPLL